MLIKYEKRWQNDEKIDMKWFATHTIGQTGVRGTRCWFKPSSLIILHERHCFLEKEDYNVDYDNEKPENEIEKINARFEKQDNNLDMGWECFGDSFNVRGHDIEEILDCIKGDSKDVTAVTKQTMIDKGYEPYVSTQPKENVKYFMDEEGRFYVVYQLEEIVQELENIMKEGINNNVTFEWI